VKTPITPLQGAANDQTSPVEDVAVNHRRFHTFVAGEFLDGADVIVVLK